MDLHKTNAVIKAIAKSYGFKTKDVDYSRLTQIEREMDSYVSFSIDFDNEFTSEPKRVKVLMSICRTACNVNANEIYKALDQIHRGVRFMNHINDTDVIR